MREILSAMNIPTNKKTEAFFEKYIQSHGGIDIFDEYHPYHQQQNIPDRPTIKPPLNPPSNKPQQRILHTATAAPPPPPPPPFFFKT
jgi:hypothetical protein